jgi:hypothetical protein
VKSTATSRPSAPRSVAVTVAGAVSVYVIWVESVIVRGVAANDLIASATGAVPIVPVAARTASPAPIVQL